MSASDIIAVVFGGICLISLLVLCFLCLNSAEKTENCKRQLYDEATKWLRRENSKKGDNE